MPIKFGPAGLGGVKESLSNLKMYNELGLRVCEIAFTYGVYIKRKEYALIIRKTAKEFNIQLSIHAPYWINLNSADKKKIEKSKERILKCCETGNWLGAKIVVFHPGYYGKFGKKQTYENIKNQILEIQNEIKKNKWRVKLAPETTGKLNVFGSVEEIAKLVEETNCSFCIDFAHILARYKTYNFKEVFKKFKKHKNMHIHFSGIDYGEKGEKHHKKTSVEEWKKLILNLPKNKNITIINESPEPVEDSVAGLKVFEKIEKK